ncbi:MAG: DUF2807 domain-containing protein [Bacteroidetes bacterium]|nr:DUF2807 domain-containing protein [Bacteroidota bacterium]
MKKIAFILCSALFFMAAMNASAQQTQTRQVSGFHAIASGGSFDVHVRLDGNESVKVTAEAGIIDEIETVVEGGTLKIRFKDHHRWYRDDGENHGKIEVDVEAKSLDALTNSGSGSIRVEGMISADNFRATLSGSGDMSASVKSGDVHAVISGSGSIKLSGSSGDADFVITGSGEMDCKHLRTNSVSATVTGSGNIYVEADKSIMARITGSGGVIYTGSASNIIAHTTGSGRVSRAD